jgi:Protein of unknown function DUF262/HNH endonuclease
MKTTRRDMTIAGLVHAHESANLAPNPDYQRGERWTDTQQRWFVDSVFRSYAIPAFYLRKREHPALDGGRAVSFEVVDGWQRTLTLSRYRQGRFPLLAVDKLQLPTTLRTLPAPWAGRFYHELSPELRDRFDQAELIAYHIDEATTDEVRDLFIRLQNGTPLTRQEVRDAWPGGVGPFIEKLAGKLEQHPSIHLFKLINRRGLGVGEEDAARDPYVVDRQLCAQALLVFLARERDPSAFPRCNARDLDRLYHENVELDAERETAQRFRNMLLSATRLFRRVSGGLPKAKKLRRLDVAAILMLLQDAVIADLKVTDECIDAAATRVGRILADPNTPYINAGRSTSGEALAAHYRFWRSLVPLDTFGVRIDDRRGASPALSAAVYERDNGLCAECGGRVEDREGEVDHFPVPHRNGGRTELNNLRLVHRGCHKRGRPATT